MLRPGSSLRFPRLAPAAEAQIAWFEVFQEHGQPPADLGVLCYQAHFSILGKPALRLSGFFFEGSAPSGCRFTSLSSVSLRLENAPRAPARLALPCVIF